MVSLALTAFLTGITEPLEFAFMFLAWPLYVAHAVLTGSSLAVMNLVGARDGFGFSAGAIDFVLNLGIAEKPWAIVVAGLVYAAIYYVIFRVMIVKLDLETPGRDPELDPAPEATTTADADPDPASIHRRRTQQDADRTVVIEKDAGPESGPGKK